MLDNLKSSLLGLMVVAGMVALAWFCFPVFLGIVGIPVLLMICWILGEQLRGRL